ncbi:hypothetical protein F5Y10DRAFT_188898 [Nemania abortiva]|nr:hypothetical protein F5Y10DRAFT_188898 [Nemania abortiva]
MQFDDVFPSREPPLRTPPTQAQTQTSAPAPTPPPAYQDPFSCFRSSGQPIPGPSDHPLVLEPSQNYQVQSPPDFQGSITGNNHNAYPAATPSLPSSATEPTTLSRAYMNNANPRPDLPTSRVRPVAQPSENSRSVDDPFLSTLFNQDFSSPSLPPQSDLPSPTILSPSGQPKHSAAGQGMPPSLTRRRGPNIGGALDLTKEEPEFGAPNFGVDLSIPSATMPPTTRGRGLAAPADHPNRKRPSGITSPSSRPSKARRKELHVDGDDQPSPFDDDLFGPDPSEIVDLSNATEVPAEFMAPKVDNRVKIGKFQCVICMDDTTSLTVTHCGHLFCSECLHSSLHIDTMKRTCPVCRSKVDLKDKKGKAVKSYYHLELKVMTATKKGKRPADT